MPRPRESDRQDIRELALEAARRLFLEHGYKNVTMRRIAREIGYTPASIYLYFKNKAEILYELHNEGFRRLNQRRAGLVKNDGLTALEKLAAGGRNYVAFAVENPDLYELMFFLPEPRDHMEANRGTAGGENGAAVDHSLIAYDNLKAAIRECMAEGTYPEVDPDVAAFFHWALVHGMASLVIRNRGPFPRRPSRELTEDVFAMMMTMISRAGASEPDA